VRLLWQATAAGAQLTVEASECQGKQQPQEMNSLLKRQTCQQLKVSCGAAACRKQDIVNNVLDKKSVCKVDRYTQMRSTLLHIQVESMNTEATQ